MIYQKVANSYLEICLLQPEANLETDFDLVLIHGFGTDGRSWKYFVNDNKIFKIHILNLPGCGSLHLNYPSKELTLNKIAKAIADYIKSIKNKIVLVGHSLGGSLVALTYWHLKNINLANQIKKIVLLAPYGSFSIPSIINKFYLTNIKIEKHYQKLQSQIFHNYKETLKKIFEFDSKYQQETLVFYKKNLKFLRLIILSMINPYSFALISKAYKSIECPLFLMLADKDKFLKTESALFFFKKNLPQLIYKIYHNCGHGFFVEKHLEFYQDIAGFLRDENES